jgi:hypothetical protein
VITDSVLSELDYFENFMDKFQPVPSERIYVLRIDTNAGDPKMRDTHFLLSTIYYKYTYEYIQPKYAFRYSDNLYLLKTEVELNWNAMNVEPIPFSKIESEVQAYCDRNIEENQMIFNEFTYCYWFASKDGVVLGGKSMTSCDIYMGDSKGDRFFYRFEEREGHGLRTKP